MKEIKINYSKKVPAMAVLLTITHSSLIVMRFQPLAISQPNLNITNADATQTNPTPPP